MRVLYLDIDSLRPDHLGAYGYHRDTSPNLDRIAREGVRFDRAYANSSPCVPARASLLSGRFGIHHGAVSHWGPGSRFDFPGEGHHYDPDRPLLSRFLRQHGYRTVSFSSFADRHQANWFYAGWSEFHTPTLKGGEEDADEINAALLPWLRAHGAEDDWFLHVQYWDPHRNYTVDPSWVARFEAEPPPAWPDAAAIADHQANYGPFSASELYPFGDGTSPVPTMPDQVANTADAKHFVDGYDGSIRFMDEQIGQVLETLAALGVLDETAIIVTADHGEALGEHGIYGDHVGAGEAVHHLPMIVRWPGAGRGLEHDGLLYNVDLQPTLCDLLDLPTPAGWDGRSFANAVRGRPWAGRPYVVLDHALYSCQRAVRTPDWLYTRTDHPGLFPFPDVALHHVASDPHQTRNVAEAHPDEVARMERQLQDWVEAQLQPPHRATDPMQEVLASGGPFRYVPLERWLRRLRDRGRDADARRILDRLPAARA